MDGNTRSLETLYPDGTRDRVEYNQSLLPFDSDPVAPVGMSCTNLVLSYRNTFYWNRKAFTATPDYRRAKIYHWLHMPDMTKTSGILESFKEPLENRIWYDYAGESSSITVGSTNRPAHIGRVLADGSSQIYTYEYNDAGNVTRTVDPLGRTFSYVYADNGIDLLETRQTRGNNDQLLTRATFDSAHLPLTSQDAAGQVTVYTYNARGQVQTQTNPKNEVTRCSYDDASRLSLVEGPLPGYVEAFTYDSVGRVRTRTDESGDVLTFDHDDLDRLIRVTHPDATFDEYAYTRLDHTSVRDRAGRKTSIDYDRVRQMTSRTDPLGRVTRFAWCACGALRSIADPMGRITSWQHDAQGRSSASGMPTGRRSPTCTRSPAGG